MGKRKTKEDFINEVTKVYGNKYDLSEMDYINLSSKIKIKCNNCGDSFHKNATNFLRGQECQKCFGGKKMTAEQFLIKAKETYGDLYDYSGSDFKGYHELINIKCLECNQIFSKIVVSHLAGGVGCPTCSHKKYLEKITLTQEEFIEKAIKIHGDKYDYKEVEYKNSTTLVKIYCKACNEFFFQKPCSHIRGSNCQKCIVSHKSKLLKKDQDVFIREAILVHGDKFDYSLINYKTNNSKIKILCKNCGKIFLQNPSDHLQGRGCSSCSFKLKGLKSRLSKEEFIERGNVVHGNLYDYSNTIYINNMHKVNIYCNKCSIDFYQMPSSHLYGKHGCPYCAHSSTSKGEKEWLDYLNISIENRQKTIKLDKNRFLVDAYDPITNTIYEYNGDFFHGNPDLFHADDINSLNKKKFGDLYQQTLNKEYILKSAGYHIISIWESEWKDLKLKLRA